MAYIHWFDDASHAARGHEAQVAELGGKNASLVIMTSAGMPVPPGFAVTADAYRRVFREAGLSERVAARIAPLQWLFVVPSVLAPMSRLPDLAERIERLLLRHDGAAR